MSHVAISDVPIFLLMGLQQHDAARKHKTKSKFLCPYNFNGTLDKNIAAGIFFLTSKASDKHYAILVQKLPEIYK